MKKHTGIYNFLYKDLILLLCHKVIRDSPAKKDVKTMLYRTLSFLFARLLAFGFENGSIRKLISQIICKSSPIISGNIFCRSMFQIYIFNPFNMTKGHTKNIKVNFYPVICYSCTIIH